MKKFNEWLKEKNENFDKIVYQVELVWNREFNFVPYGNHHATIEKAINYAQQLENMGDGEAVKKTRVVDNNGKIVWAYGKLIR